VRRSEDPKRKALRAQGALKPHPEEVDDPLFAESAFFETFRRTGSVLSLATAKDCHPSTERG
jgi:hypothetical protein